MVEFITFAAALILTLIGVEIFRAWSLKKGIVDLPNERSLHDGPIPRGGGLVIVSVCLILYSAITIFYTQSFVWSYLAGAVLIALVSWIDDLYSISFIYRLICHIAAASLLVFEHGYLSVIHLPFTSASVDLGVFGAVFAVLWIVWLINAYNFMDGIDGIAGLQAIVAGLGWLFVGIFLAYPTLYFYGGILVFACFGFLVHNWQPAKIFMGDVGSAFLGFTFAAMPFIASGERNEGTGLLMLTAILLVWFFVFDSVLTFFVRLIKGQRVWRPHREHLYQTLVISGMSHQLVTVIYGFLSMTIAILLILVLRFSGIFGFLLILTVLATSAFLLAFASAKKNLDLTS